MKQHVIKCKNCGTKNVLVLTNAGNYKKNGKAGLACACGAWNSAIYERCQSCGYKNPNFKEKRDYGKLAQL